MKTSQSSITPSLLFHCVLLCVAAPAGCDDSDDPQTTDVSSSQTESSGDSSSSDSAASDTAADGSSGGDATVDEAAVLAAAMDYLNMELVSVEPRSSEHGLADTVQFYVAADTRELYLSIDPDNPSEVTFPQGALIVKENLDPEGAADGFFAMYKGPEGYDPEGNDWYWLRVDSAGDAANAGKVGFCKDCHARVEVSDLVFGVPLDNRP